MNKDQVNGVAKDIAGQVQEAAGKLVGNKDQEAKGLMKQVEGKTEKMYGDAKEVIKDAVNKA
ncbi:MAG: CsbD family protein [Burkholderiaceae bacterium]